MGITSKLSDFRSFMHALSKLEELGTATESKRNDAKRLYSEYYDYLSDYERNVYGLLLQDYDLLDEIEHSGGFMQVLLNRRSVRKYDGAIDDNDVNDLLTALQWSPSACNMQPIELVLVTDRTIIKKICTIKGQHFIGDVESLLLVLCDNDSYVRETAKDYLKHLDSGVAIQNILLMGEYIEIGMCLVNCTEANSNKIKYFTEVPEKYSITGIITCGKISHKPKVMSKKECKLFMKI